MVCQLLYSNNLFNLTAMHIVSTWPLHVVWVKPEFSLEPRRERHIYQATHLAGKGSVWMKQSLAIPRSKKRHGLRENGCKNTFRLQEPRDALSLETVISCGCIHINIEIFGIFAHSSYHIPKILSASRMRLGIPTRHTRERFKPWSVGIQVCSCASVPTPISRDQTWPMLMKLGLKRSSTLKTRLGCLGSGWQWMVMVFLQSFETSGHIAESSLNPSFTLLQVSFVMPWESFSNVTSEMADCPMPALASCVSPSKVLSFMLQPEECSRETWLVTMMEHFPMNWNS